MNPEAGLIQGPFREKVILIAKNHPNLDADEVLRRARGDRPIPPQELPPVPLEFEF